MGATTPGGLPYPAPTDSPDTPFWAQQLAQAVEARSLQHNKAARKRIQWNRTTATTDASGYITVTHAGGFTPSSVLVTPFSPITAGGAGAIFGFALADSFTATTFRVRCLFANAVAIATTSVSFSWVMYE